MQYLKNKNDLQAKAFLKDKCTNTNFLSHGATYAYEDTCCTSFSRRAQAAASYHV